MLFWPSRLDPIQKGPQLFSDILFKTVSDYRDQGLQVAIIADGPHQKHFHDIVRQHDLGSRVAVTEFDEELSHLGYAAADFMVMPSLFEPCGLPQMISPLYGTLPIVHATGGLHDTVTPLNLERAKGNGFRFDIYSADGLRWAIDEALRFHALPADQKAPQIARIMRESPVEFSHEASARRYIDIYESMLDRPLVARYQGEFFFPGMDARAARRAPFFRHWDLRRPGPGRANCTPSPPFPGPGRGFFGISGRFRCGIGRYGVQIPPEDQWTTVGTTPLRPMPTV